jgi:hypothetical protein
MRKKKGSRRALDETPRGSGAKMPAAMLARTKGRAVAAFHRDLGARQVAARPKGAASAISPHQLNRPSTKAVC